jgi:hypothetical protein
MADETYIQLLTTGGGVFDVAPNTWEMIQDKLDAAYVLEDMLPQWVEFIDRYGATCRILSTALIAVREFSPTINQAWKAAHEDEEEDGRWR